VTDFWYCGEDQTRARYSVVRPGQICSHAEHRASSIALHLQLLAKPWPGYRWFLSEHVMKQQGTRC